MLMLTAGELNLGSADVREAMGDVEVRGRFEQLSVNFVCQAYLLPLQIRDKKRERDFICSSGLGRVVTTVFQRGDRPQGVWGSARPRVLPRPAPRGAHPRRSAG